jgi:hypothetical protein
MLLNQSFSSDTNQNKKKSATAYLRVFGVVEARQLL